MSTKNKIPQIDLNNFEDSKFKDCDYILTSPLSLQACKNLGFKPIELLPNESENFDNDTECIRKNNVDRARDERLKLIKNLNKQPLVVNGRFIEIDRDRSDGYLSDGSFSEKSVVQTHDTFTKNSLMKEISFQQKRRQLTELAREDKNDLKKNIDMKLTRAARNRELLQKKRCNEIEQKREQFDNKVKNVSARRQRLDREIQNYYRELEHFQRLSLDAAAKKSSRKMHWEQSKIQTEREQKDLMIRHKRQLLEEETENKTQDLLSKIVERDRQDEEFMRRKLEKMMESRCYANEAQKLREELRTVYGLDSFDKKVTNVDAINRVLK